MVPPSASGSRRAPAAPIVFERVPGCASAPVAPWRRHEPEKTVLWKLVASELPAFIAHIEETTGRGLPAYIDRELRRYLDCGLLQRGFARVKCLDCKAEILVAYSCKGRGLCPSCTARKMVDTAAHLVDRLVPRVPIRQFVITFPKRVRWHLAHDPKLATQALTLCLRVIFKWHRRVARCRGIAFQAPKRSQSARSAAVAFVQRFDSALALDWHIHALVCDGVFARRRDHPDARPRFHRLPPPTDGDVAALLTAIAKDVLALLHRRGRLDDDPEPDDTRTQLELFAARPLAGGPGKIPPPPPLCARLEGFSLHAARAIHENDRQGLERLARYCARPALALTRLSLTDNGHVRYRMKRTFSDGRSEVVLPPHEFIARLCALIPPPRVHLVRYYGAFSPSARGRAALTGQRPKKPNSKPTSTDDKPPAPPSPPSVDDPTALAAPPPVPLRPRRLDWAALLERVYLIDVLACHACGGRLRVLAFLTDERVVRTILDHLGISPVAPVVRARPPPDRSLHRMDLPDDPFVDSALID